MSDTTAAPARNKQGIEAKWWTLIAVCIATFMLLLDVTIVNVALKTIQNHLHSSFSDLQWVVDAYALTLASFLLLFGSLADLFGRRRIFVFGIFVFTGASLLAALSVNPLMLNIARGIQGVGGAAMFSTALALLAQDFKGKERGTAFGIWGATTGAAVAIGPLIGGALTDGFGWESIFYINVPVGIIAVILTLTKVHDVHEAHGKPDVDFVGFVTFSLSLFSLIFGLVRGNDEGWGSSTILTALIGSAVLMAIFIFNELKREKPMLDLKLFKNPTFVAASIAAFALSASMFSLFLYITLYFQNVLNFTPLQTGVRFLPQTLLMFFISAGAGKLSTKFSVRWFFLGGLFLVFAGLVTFAMVNTTSAWTVLLPGLCVAGFGIGMINPPLASTAVGVVEPRYSGMASGINSTFRQLGISTGIAGLGAVFQHDITKDVVSRVSSTTNLDPATAKTLAHSVTSGQAAQIIAGLPVESRAAAGAAVKYAFVTAFDTISVIAAIIALVGAVTSAALVRKKDFAHGSAQAQTRDAAASHDSGVQGVPEPA